MAAPSVTYSFSNSTTADASQVNTNFTDLINAMSDGTKDFSINALTVAGTATLNGNIALGNSSSDDLTITASLASTISIKTTNTYNIGSATLGLLSVYFGSGAGAFSTRVIGGAAAASWTLTLPTAVPTANNQVFTGTTGGVGSWTQKNLRSVVSKTTTYTIALTDDIITGSASGGAFTISLPTAASASGYEFTIIKGDSSANAITIDPDGTETIQAATTRKLSTQYESLTIYSNGSEWLIKEHAYPRGWVSITGGGSWSANTTYTAFRRRIGDSAEFIYQVNLAGAPTSAALTLNTGLTIDTAKLPSTDTSQSLGTCTLLDSGTLNYNQGKVQYVSTTAVAPHYNVSGTSESQAITQAAPITFASGDRVYARFTVPISGWEG